MTRTITKRRCGTALLDVVVALSRLSPAFYCVVVDSVCNHST